jgi:hypothetical protein
MSLDDVAKVTKIQPRILERLEAGKLDGLPPEVFVRGFVRSFARCVGLDEREALRRYAACAIGSHDLTPAVRALVEVMADLAPASATTARATPRKMHAVEVIDLAGPVMLAPPAEPDPPGAAGAPEATSAESPAVAVATVPLQGDEADAPPVAASVAAPIAASVAAPIATAVEVPAPGDAPAASAEPLADSDPAPVACESATSPVPADPPASSRKKRSRRRKAREAAAAREAAEAAMAAAASASAGSTERSDATGDAAAASPRPRAGATSAAGSTSAPWRRLVRRAPAASTAPARPSLVIDDADPESAERMLEERAERAGTQAPRRSFLPPILLDREDRSARQGGLTLAVILLLIAATLTLSYLMRRPSASGDGVTGREAPAQQAEQG